jgi:membrane protein
MSSRLPMPAAAAPLPRPQPARAPAAPQPLRPHHLPKLLKDSVLAWINDDAPSMGAALAYYTLFSIAPLLLIVIGIAGAVFGMEAARGAIFDQLSGLLGAEAATAVQGLLQSVDAHGDSLLSTVIGAVLLFIGATTVVAELQRALDAIWRAPSRPKPPGWLAFLRTRLLSFGLILGVGFLLMVSLVVSAGLAAWGHWWAPAFGGASTALQAANFVVGLLMTTALFALIYKLMPSVHIAWRDVLIGAAGTALLFSVGKTLIGLYIGTSSVTSGFGAASSLVVLPLWVYYSAQIFLVGAEFTWLYAQRHGSMAGRAAAP